MISAGPAVMFCMFSVLSPHVLRPEEVRWPSFVWLVAQSLDWVGVGVGV